MRFLQNTVAIASFVLLPLFATAVQAGEKIVVDAANPPFMYAANGKPAGVYPALVASVFQRMNMTADVTAVPWRRALSDLDDGLVGVAGIYKNAERVKKYDYSEKLFDEVVQLYTRADDAFVYRDVDSLKGRTVGVILGWSYGDEFDAARKANLFKTEEVASDGLNFSKLVSGRVDTILAIREAGSAVIAGNDLQSKVKALSPALSNSPSFLAFNKSTGHEAILTRFNETLAAMRKDGSFDLLVKSSLAN